MRQAPHRHQEDPYAPNAPLTPHERAAWEALRAPLQAAGIALTERPPHWYVAWPEHAAPGHPAYAELDAALDEAFDEAEASGDYAVAAGIVAWRLRAMLALADACDTAEEAQLRGNLGDSLSELANYVGAKDQFEQGLALLERPHVADNLGLDAERTWLRINLGNALRDLGDLLGAKAQYEQALELLARPHLADNPDLDAERASLRWNLGVILGNLGDLRGAKAQFEHALALHEQPHLADIPGLDADRAMLRWNLGVILSKLGDLRGAKAQFEHALALHEQPHLADIPGLDDDRAMLRVNLGITLSELGDLRGAKDQYQKALALHEQPHLADNPGLDAERARLRMSLGNTLSNLGDLLGAKGEHQKALALHELPHLADNPGLDANRAALRTNLGTTLRDLGDLLGAKGEHQKALALHKRPHLADNPGLDADRARLRVNLGITLSNLGDLLGAKDQYQKALALHEQSHLADIPGLDADRAVLRMNLGGILRNLGDLRGAKDQYQKALALHERSHLADIPGLDADRARLRTNLGTTFSEFGDLLGAKDQYQKALALHERPHLADNPGLDAGRAALRTNLGNALSNLGDLRGAKDQCQKALALHERPHLADNPGLDADRAMLRWNLGIILSKFGDLRGAKAQFEHALALHEQPHLADIPGLDADRAMLRMNLGNAHAELGDLLGAKGEYQKARALHERPHLADNPGLDADRARLCINLGSTLSELGDQAGARAQTEVAAQTLSESPAMGSTWLMQAARLGSYLPSLPQAGTHARALSARFLEAIDLQPPGVLATARGHFDTFHRAFLAYALEHSPETVPEVLSAMQGQTLGRLMLAELESQAVHYPPEDVRRRYLDALQTVRQRSLALGGRLDMPGGPLSLVASNSTNAPDPVQPYLQALEHYQQVRAELEAAYPDFPTPGRWRVSAAELQQRLTEDRRAALVLLVQLPAEGESPGGFHLVWLTAEAIDIIACPGLAPLPAQAQAYRRTSGARGGYRDHTVAHAGAAQDCASADTPDPDTLLSELEQGLREHLWRPLQAALPAQIARIQLVTHGEGHTLPLELGRPEAWTVASYPGLVFFERAERATGGALERIGAHVYTPETPPGPGGAIPLVGADQNLLKAHWPAAQLQVLAETNDDRSGTPFDFLLLAGHGHHPEHDPLASSLLIGPGEDLNFERLLELDLRARIVFLAACVVGRVRELGGEPLGLISALFLRGARYVVAALQPVEDFYIPLLGALFVQALRGDAARGQAPLPPAAALAEAKRRLREGAWYPESAERVRAAYRPVLLEWAQRVGNEPGWRIEQLAQCWPLAPQDHARLGEPRQAGLVLQRLSRQPEEREGLVERTLTHLIDTRDRLPVAHLSAWVRGFGPLD